MTGAPYSRRECASWKRRRLNRFARKAATKAAAAIACAAFAWAMSAALLYAIAETATRGPF
jgi:hypothetical protein